MDSKKFVTRIGNFAVEYSGLLGGIVPFVLVVYALQAHAFVSIIPNVYVRFIVSVISALYTELYMVGVMILSRKVQTFNASVQKGEVRIHYNSTLAKVVYAIAALLIATIKFVIPVLFDVPDGTMGFIIIPIIVTTWFGYGMFSTYHAIEDALDERRKLEEKEANKTKVERDTLSLSIEMQREKRLATEAEAKKAEAEALKEKETKLKERQRIKAREITVKAEKKPAAPPTNGNGKLWRDYSLTEIAEAVAGGTPPKISIHGKAMEQRFKLLYNVFGTNEFTKPQAMEHVDVSDSTFLNDVKAFQWNKLLVVVDPAKGVYRLNNGNNRVSKPAGSEG